MRKVFIMIAIAAGAALFIPASASAAGPMVDTDDDDMMAMAGMMGMPGMQGMSCGMCGKGGMGGGMMGPGGMGMTEAGRGHDRMGHIWMLDLSDEQRAKVRNIHDDLRREQWGLMGKLMDEQAKLRDLGEDETLDLKKTGAAYDAVAAVKKQMLLARLDAMNKCHALLTKEQKEQLKKMRHGGMGMMGGGMGVGGGMGCGMTGGGHQHGPMGR